MKTLKHICAILDNFITVHPYLSGVIAFYILFYIMFFYWSLNKVSEIIEDYEEHDWL